MASRGSSSQTSAAAIGSDQATQAAGRCLLRLRAALRKRRARLPARRRAAFGPSREPDDDRRKAIDRRSVDESRRQTRPPFALLAATCACGSRWAFTLALAFCCGRVGGRRPNVSVHADQRRERPAENPHRVHAWILPRLRRARYTTRPAHRCRAACGRPSRRWSRTRAPSGAARGKESIAAGNARSVVRSHTAELSEYGIGPRTGR